MRAWASSGSVSTPMPAPRQKACSPGVLSCEGGASGGAGEGVPAPIAQLGQRLEGEQLNARRSFRVRTRYRTDVTTSQRLVLPDGRVLDPGVPAGGTYKRTLDQEM